MDLPAVIKQPAPLTRKWTDRFALDFALLLEGSGDDPAEMLKEHGYEPSDLEMFTKDALFMQRVGRYQTDLKERGLTFKLKAQVQAEMLLDTSWDLIHNAEVSPAVRADLIKSTIKWSGFEPKGGEELTGKGVSINIHLNDAPGITSGVKVIDHE